MSLAWRRLTRVGVPRLSQLNMSAFWRRPRALCIKRNVPVYNKNASLLGTSWRPHPHACSPFSVHTWWILRSDLFRSCYIHPRKGRQLRPVPVWIRLRNPPALSPSVDTEPRRLSFRDATSVIPARSTTALSRVVFTPNKDQASNRDILLYTWTCAQTINIVG